MSEPGEDAMPSDSAARPIGDMPDSDGQGDMSRLGIRSISNNTVSANVVGSPHTLQSSYQMNIIVNRMKAYRISGDQLNS